MKNPQTPDTPEAKVSERVTLIVVAVVQFVVPFLMSAIGVALPAIGKELSATAVQLSLIQSAQVLAIASLLLPMGRLADIYGRKRIFAAGISVLCITTLALAMARSIEMFIFLRFLQGIGSSMIFSTSVAILTSVFPPGRRGRAMGIIVGCVYMGMATGPSISGFIIEYLGWRWVFLSIFVADFVAATLAIGFLKGEWASASGEPFDWLGTVVFILSMVLIVYGATEWVREDHAKVVAIAGVAGMGLFVHLQWRTAHPILDIHLLVENLTFTFSNLATFINYASAFSFLFFFSLYLQYAKGLSPKAAGLILVIQPLVQAALAPIAGRLSDSFPPTAIATVGMAFCTVGLFSAGHIEIGASMAMIVMVTVLLGISLGLFSTPNMNAVMGCVAPRHVGTASSFLATMRSTGMLASATIIAIVFSSYMGDAQVSSSNIGSFMDSMHTSFYLFSALSLLGTVFSAVNRRFVGAVAVKEG